MNVNRQTSNWRRRFAAAVLTTVAFFAVTASAQIRQGDNDLGESILLLSNLLKDLSKESDLDQKYTLYRRARTTLNGIHRRLSRNQLGQWHRRLKDAFRELPAPAEVITPIGLRFELMRKGDMTFYWSAEVSLTQLAACLNDGKHPATVLEEWLGARQNVMRLDLETGRFMARSSTRAVHGASHTAGRAFAEWLSETTGIHYSLPTEPVVLTMQDSALSCWTDSQWRQGDLLRREAVEMYGGSFYRLCYYGEMVDELPEASYPDTTVRLVTTVKNGKIQYLRRSGQN